MKTFIIDGYNVIYKIRQLESRLDQSLQAARDALVNFININKPHADKYVVVFEGKDEHFGLGSSECGQVNVVFTNTNEEADRRIVDMLKNIDDTRNFVIVSDDNYVLNHAKSFRAGRMSAAEFFKIKKALRP